jgi:hypothetical protein
LCSWEWYRRANGDDAIDLRRRVIKRDEPIYTAIIVPVVDERLHRGGRYFALVKETGAILQIRTWVLRVYVNLPREHVAGLQDRDVRQLYDPEKWMVAVRISWNYLAQFSSAPAPSIRQDTDNIPLLGGMTIYDKLAGVSSIMNAKQDFAHYSRP